MPRTEVPVASLATAVALASLAVLAAASPTMSSNSLPLSYVLADTAFLADEVSAISDAGEDWSWRVSEYLSLVQRTHGMNSLPLTSGSADEDADDAPRAVAGRGKRHLPTDRLSALTKDPQGVYLLRTPLVERFTIPAKFPNDLVLFPRVEAGVKAWYAAALEADGEHPQTSLANALVLYKLMGNRFLYQTRVPAFGASALAVQEIEGWVYLVASERMAQHRDKPQGGSILYRLSLNGRTLVAVETLETTFPSDLAFWEYSGAHYLAVTTEFTNASGVFSFSADTLVYKWYGEHLDIIQRLPTSGAKAVTAFTIGSNQYLAVVNHINDQYETNIDSTIYRFDMVRGQFVVHQRLRTHAAVDVAFFTMNRTRGQDYFLVIANAFYEGPDKVRNLDTNSVLYKWSEGFFVPFQSFRLTGASLWTPFQGPRGETVLLGADAHGILAYQYDGWRFQQQRVATGPVTSLRAVVFESEMLAVVASKQHDGAQVNVYSLRFELSAPLDELYLELHRWCEGEMVKLDGYSVDTLMQRVRSAPKWDSPVVEINSVTFESDSTIKVVTVNATQVIDPAYVKEANDLATDLYHRTKELEQADDTIRRALKKNENNFVDAQVFLDNATVMCPSGGCRFGQASVRLLNGEDAEDLVHRAVRTDQDLHLTTLHLASAIVPGGLVSKRVLGEEAPLVNLVDTKTIMGILDVDELVIRRALNVSGSIDGVRFNPDNVVIKDGDQRLSGIASTQWQVNKLILHGHVNGMRLDVSQPTPPHADVEAGDSFLQALAVNDIHVAGLFGDVDIRRVSQHALRTRGDQVLTGEHSFERLKVKSARTAAGSRIEDVARIDKDLEAVSGSLQFTRPIEADTMQVYNRLVGVDVAKDGSLDLLLTNGPGGSAQSVTGSKKLQRMTVTEEGRIHGRVLGLVLPAEEEDLVTVIQEDRVITGDVTITGRSDILGGNVYATDVVDPGSGLTLLNVLRDAVHLDSPLPPNVVIKDLEVKSNLEVKNLNGVPTSTWIEDRPDIEVHLSQPVSFHGGLTVTDKTVLNGEVNGVNLVDLAVTSLRTTGDQVIHGLKKFPFVKTTAAWSNQTMLGGLSWQDVWAQRAQKAPRDGIVRIDKDVVVEGALSVKKLAVDGTLGGVNIGTVLKDSVFEDSREVTVIDGPKTFAQTVHADSLHVDPATTGGNLPGIVPRPKHPEETEKVFEFPSGITLNQPLSVAHLTFIGTLDRMTDAEWSAPWLELDGDQTLWGPQTIHGNVLASAGVRAGKVNNVDISRLAESVARIDDPNLVLGSVSFEGGLVARGPVTAGAVDGVDLADALLARGALSQEVRSRLVFAGGLEAQGLSLEGTLSGEKFKDLCAFANPPPTSVNQQQHLAVEGDLLMDQEPLVQHDINGLSMKKLMENAWLRDKPARIMAEMEFGDLHFQSAVSVKERIDGVNLDAVAERYLSLTKDGTVTTKLNVDGGVVVDGKLTSSPTAPVEVGGLLEVGYGDDKLVINLGEFTNAVLLDGPDQDITAHMQFGVVTASGNLELNGTVSGLNLDKDVVLNKELQEAMDHNKITGAKSVRGLRVTDLGLQQGVRVQGVDLNAWKSGAVCVTGDYTIEGAKTLLHPHVAGDMIVNGLVAGVRVDAQHLLLRHSDQLIQGAKTFRPAPLQGLGLRVKQLGVVGRVNDVDMTELLNNQAYKTSDVDIVTPLVIDRPLRAQSVQLDRLFQGVNVSGLIEEALNPPGLNLYTEKHDALLRTAEHVQRSLKAQGYYLNYYHAAAMFRSNVRAIVPLGKAAGAPGEVDDEAYAIAMVKETVPGGNLEVHFYSWKADAGMLVNHPTLHYVSLPATVRLIAPARYAGHNAMYWETDERSGVHHGSVIGLMRDGLLGHAKLLQDALASAWVSVTMVGDMSCLIRGSPGVGTATGFCSVQCLGAGRDDVVNHALPVSRPTHAASLTVRGVPHVFVASGVSEESEGAVYVWRWEADKFQLLQTLGVVNATAVAAVEHRGVQYLASASGHVQDAPHEGMVHISRFDHDTGRWTHWVSVAVEGPHALQFAKLPSDELALYVSTTCPTDSLVVFLYRGVSGFVRRTSAAVPLHGVLSAFTTAQHQHVVAVSGGARATETVLLQASFKGSWEASDIAFRGSALATRR
ncbi:uncharacterized protein LOC113203634 [Frankliniella occidentalis]|uniref:Uncharacterized protein LOC113203634 n=1 Tax=Frankliniella occidentalis TaxID=133901 RepID=A0A6J1S0Q9_FRAOC|nr:uncharacterized protein LOC113203634 [Frankliniella occidentalis]